MLYLHVLQLCIASEGKMDLTSLSKSFVVYEGWLHYNSPGILTFSWGWMAVRLKNLDSKTNFLSCQILITDF